MIFIAGMAIAVFFEFLLLAKREKSGADRILATWMFVISAHIFLFYLWYSEKAYEYPFLLGTGLPLPLFHGIFLYLYVGSVTGRLPTNRALLALHFVPIASMYGYLVTFFILPAETKILVYKNQGAGYETFNAIRLAAVLLSGVFYVAWSSLLLARHRRTILDRFSYRHRVDLRWLQILIWGMGAIWLLVFIGDETLIFSGVTAFVILIGFFGIRQERIFPAPPDTATTIAPVIARDEPSTSPMKEKYAKSGLSPELSDRLYVDLTRLMKEETLFKDSGLSADDLAGRLGTHANNLSQVINEKEGKNFYDYVNGYRLEEFKRLVADPKNRHLTLLALAFDCGFNSKSSFNRHFKKVTGRTPSEFASTLPPG